MTEGYVMDVELVAVLPNEDGVGLGDDDICGGGKVKVVLLEVTEHLTLSDWL